ncbi:mechanosensitive ion channel family protein [Halomarina ordinaria]|uniref:Mechanosensitive ion channel family protein n=1 Tax=Halomarina ordinaria TaxID=3033939 RepID=A0ABD5U8N9_9EURY|nr:mechanosensitive ion channel family protein [Halomarina sp. PSRA2]
MGGVAVVLTPLQAEFNGSNDSGEGNVSLTPDRVGPVGETLRDVGVPYAEVFGGLITLVGVFLALYLLGRTVGLPLVRRALAARDVEGDAQRPLVRIARIVLAFAALAVGFAVGGYGNLLSSFTTIGAAATLAIGFALRDLIANFVAGVFIYVDRPFRIGHWIEWPSSGDLPSQGIVTDISLRVTRIQTFDNEIITVPNAKLTENEILNPTARDRLRISFTFGIGYEDDIQRATDIIVEEATAHPKVLEHPTPTVQLSEDPLADSYVGLDSWFWIDTPNRRKYLTVRSEVVRAVKERFEEAGIDIPYPQIDLSGRVETGPPRRPLERSPDGD